MTEEAIENNVIERLELLKSALESFREHLKTVEGFNIFSAVGMQTQEVKHSAFLRWLFTPTETHKLKNAFLKKFIEKLFVHSAPIAAGAQVKANGEILKNYKIKLYSTADLKAFVNAKDLTVETERVVIKSTSRIDILLASESAKTLMVIENKVFTGTHNEQLKKYEENEVGNYQAWKDWKKIFVYLTPHGAAPFEEEEGVLTYKENWCNFSYEAIVEIVEELLSELPQTQTRLKLKYLLEDYKKMVDVRILLKQPEVGNVCRDICKKYKEELDLLFNYASNDKVYEYCLQWIRLNVTNIVQDQLDDGLQTEFITKPIAEYFIRKGCSLKTEDMANAIKCDLSSKDGPVNILCCLEKSEGSEWSSAQKEINALAAKLFSNGGTKQMGRRYCRLFTVTLLKEEDRQKKFDEIKEQLNKNLQEFLENLRKLEEAIAVL